MVYLERSLDATFGALADPTRRSILRRLSRGDETIKMLAQQFTMTLPAVSKHVRVLESAGLVRVQRVGRARQTTLVGAPMQQAASFLEQYRPFWDHQFDRLAEFLNATAAESTEWPTRKPPTPSLKSAAPSTQRENASTPRGRGRKNSSDGARRGT